jgi:hypothetical protein
MSEPANRGETAPSGDWLDSALAGRSREHADAYIMDDGFAARVMRALPAPVRSLPWRRPVLAVLWTVAVAGFAVTLPGAAVDLTRETFRLLAVKPVTLPDLALLAGIVGAGMWATTWITWRRA